MLQIETNMNIREQQGEKSRAEEQEIDAKENASSQKIVYYNITWSN